MAVTASFSPGTGQLTVNGDGLGNSIVVGRNAAGNILVNGGAVAVTGGTPTVANTSLIQVFGQDGDDTLTLDESNGALPAADLFGGLGNDVLSGGSGADQLSGEEGDDTLLGKGGADTLLGGDGNDVLTGGSGNDQVFGGGGNDRMIWNPGDGSDLLEGGDDTDTAEVNGGNGTETFTVTANGSRVRFDRTTPAPFTLDIGSTENLVLNANGGDDIITAGSGLAGLIQLTLDGGDGNDTINGGNGADTLLGGGGNDTVKGGGGNDVAFLGTGDDTFVWNPGDASDTVEGQGGADTLQFNGANVNENIDISANGSRVRFTRDVAAITEDLNGIETVAFRALGGADTIRVHDLAGTSVNQVNLDLSASGGGGDAQADQIFVDGSSRNNTITVAAAGGVVNIEGLHVDVAISNAEIGLDVLTINGLDGNDTITVDESGGALPAANLFGGNGDDVLTGGSGNDQMFGEAGNDRMIWDPGDGSDLLEGGDETDTAEVNGDNGAETFTVIANGSRVRLDRTTPAPFTLDIGSTENLVLNANGGDDVITVGNGLATLIQITIDGGDGNDTITGGDGADTLLGGDGNDIVGGGRGNDVAFLGTGDDTFVWNPGDASDTVEGQGGADTLQFNGANINENIDISANGSRVRFTRDVAAITADLNRVETIAFRALGGADTIRVHDLTGTSVTQVNLDLSASGGGGDAQADQIFVDGSSRNNTITVAAAGGVVSVNGLRAAIALSSVETGLDALTVNGLAGNDTIDAGSLATGTILLTIDGGSGTDVITGSLSADTVLGGIGNDRVIDTDFVNFDVYDGGDGVDTIDYSHITFGDGVVTINLATGQTAVNGGNTETIANFENATGSQGGETIIGSAAANVLDGAGGSDTLDGGAGKDTLIGGAGDDTYFVDAAADKVIEAAAGGVDTVFASVNYALQSGQEVEFLRANAGATGLVLTGNQFANTLIGNGGDDRLDGGTGADTMRGGVGADTYFFDNAGDVIDETGGDGIDEIFASRSLSLADSSRVMGVVENLTLTGISNTTGTGNTSDNVITGNGGANTLDGADGDDTLDGGDGADSLIGGVGADRLTGGLNADMFVFDSTADSTVASAGRDLIVDFSRAEGDKIDVSHIDANSTVGGNQTFAFISAAAFSGTAGELRAVVTGSNTLVSADIDGNAVADFSILVRGTITFQSSDFTP